jgi:glycosyltransferase involved in cell wall biosynthesis
VRRARGSAEQRPAAGEPCELSIVVPAFDEVDCLEAVVRAIDQVATGLGRRFEIVIVDDGSTDGTGALAAELAGANPRIRVVRHERNAGSGAAIRSGIAASRGTFVIYVPADGQFHLPEIADYLAAAEHADIVIGARSERSDYSPFRRTVSWVYGGLVNRLFDHRYRDVNWVHLWRREVFDRVEPRSRGVFFLEETLVRAADLGLRIVEIDSRYLPRAGGAAKGASASSIAVTVRDLAGFWLGLGTGEPPRASAPASALRAPARFLIAGAMIPVGLALGAGSLLTGLTRKRKRE